MDTRTTQTMSNGDKVQDSSKHQKMLEIFMWEDSEEAVTQLRRKFKEAGLKVPPTQPKAQRQNPQIQQNQ